MLFCIILSCIHMSNDKVNPEPNKKKQLLSSLLVLRYEEEFSHHHPPCPSHWGISSSGSLRRCKRRPSGTLDRTASPPSPPLSPDPHAPLRTTAEAKPPEPACWTPDCLHRGVSLGWSDLFCFLSVQLVSVVLLSLFGSSVWDQVFPRLHHSVPAVADPMLASPCIIYHQPFSLSLHLLPLTGPLAHPNHIQR